MNAARRIAIAVFRPIPARLARRIVKGKQNAARPATVPRGAYVKRGLGVFSRHRGAAA